MVLTLIEMFLILLAQVVVTACSSVEWGGGLAADVAMPMDDPDDKFDNELNMVPAGDVVTGDGNPETVEEDFDKDGTADLQIFSNGLTGTNMEARMSLPPGTSTAGDTFFEIEGSDGTRVKLACTDAIPATLGALRFSFKTVGTNGKLDSGIPIDGAVYQSIDPLPSTMSRYGCWTLRITTDPPGGVNMASGSKGSIFFC